MFAAALYGKADVLKVLIAAKANFLIPRHTDGKTPLRAAMEEVARRPLEGHLEVVELLQCAYAVSGEDARFDTLLPRSSSLGANRHDLGGLDTGTEHHKSSELPSLPSIAVSVLAKTVSRSWPCVCATFRHLSSLL